MLEIKAIEDKVNKAMEGGKDVKVSDLEIVPALYWAYVKSKDANNDRIDFNDVIWDREIEPIAAYLKENGITEFTVSSTFSSLITVLAAFEKHGFVISGLTEVYAPYTDYITQQRAVIPAILMTAK